MKIFALRAVALIFCNTFSSFRHFKCTKVMKLGKFKDKVRCEAFIE